MRLGHDASWRIFFCERARLGNRDCRDRLGEYLVLTFIDGLAIVFVERVR